MKLGLVSDIHGNVATLEKAFDLMSHADEFLCLGDAIDQFRFSNDVVRLLRERCTHVIHGNHEEIFFGAGSERARAHDWIDRDLMSWLGALGTEQALERCGKTIHLVHSTPWFPRGNYVTPSSRDFSRFGDSVFDIVIYGHTHVPVASRVGRTLVVNPGSTGQGNLVGLAREMNCAVLDVATEEVELIRFTA